MCFRYHSQHRGDSVVDGYLGELTTEERMLLHLHDHVLPEGEWEAPLSLTQAGVSAAVHVQRKHVPRTLKRLESNGFLISSKRHIPGAKQRRIVYGLTSEGRNRASLLRNKILSREVKNEGTSIKISELR
jgi:DNA-binding MarR family transcriptional regulator